MKKVIPVIIIVIGLCLYGVLGNAGSYSIGKTTLSGSVIELDNLTITASGKASLVASTAGSPKPGTMQLESIKSERIRIELVRDDKGNTAPKEASATGGVTIKAKRADKETNENGKVVTKIRNVTATADSATLPSGEESVELSGKAVVKVTEPGNSQPVAVISGDRVVIRMNENKIRVAGESGKPAEFTFSPKEGQK